MDSLHNFLSSLKGQVHDFMDTKGVLLGGTPFMLTDKGRCLCGYLKLSYLERNILIRLVSGTPRGGLKRKSVDTTVKDVLFGRPPLQKLGTPRRGWCLLECRMSYSVIGRIIFITLNTLASEGVRVCRH